ncbi:hypothetical protein ACFQL1_01325 [Halomicroarcula sp. GCM10025709]|uniref:hypothetical protein n=1 Tax=Haloarcula TaxID=2237 RepID=UPI0024C30533|nr:hypothetical protein [Halomicroarcula sp. YJ-61-S]
MAARALTRRGVLAAVAAVSGAVGAVLTDPRSGSADGPTRSGDEPLGCGRTSYARRRRLGAFLNETAAFVEPPVWDGSLVDRTDQETVEVTVGEARAVSVPGVGLATAPVAFDPAAVLVSPGTTVRWTWAEGVDPALPSDVVALSVGCFDSGVRPPGGEPFTHTFRTWGHYLYYSTLHGAPYRVPSVRGDSVTNPFGMRGAVVVTGV